MTGKEHEGILWSWVRKEGPIAGNAGKRKPDEIHLEKITWNNYDRICRLRVTKEQDDFVARNERRCRRF